MLSDLDKIDRAVFLALNGCHAEWLDRPMWLISQMWFWIPVYVLLLWALYKRYPKRAYLLVIGAIALTMFFTDFMAATFVKETVQRLRPSRNPELEGMVHHVIGRNNELYRGGSFGFFSNHASNYFGVISIFIFLMKPLKRWIVALLILWASLIAYSRIYLGVHYPGDILVGIIYGVTVAWLVSKLFFYALNKY